MSITFCTDQFNNQSGADHFIPFIGSTNKFSEHNVPFGLKYFCITGHSLDPLCHSSSTCCKAALSRRLRSPRWQWQRGQPSSVLRPGQQRAWLGGHEQQSTLLQAMQVGVMQRHSKDTPNGGVSCTRSLDAPESLCQSSLDWSRETYCLGNAACCLLQEYHCFKRRIDQCGYIQTRILKILPQKLSFPPIPSPVLPAVEEDCVQVFGSDPCLLHTFPPPNGHNHKPLSASFPAGLY